MRKNRKPRVFWITALAVVGIVAGLAGYKVLELMKLQKMAAEFEMPAAAVNVAEPMEIRWGPTRVVSGFVEAAKSTAITTDVPGLVEAVMFESGKEVKKGDALVKLDDSQEVIRLRGLAAELAVAEADFARSKRLYENRAISDAEYETARAKRAAVLAQKGELERIIEKKMIRALFDGTVGLRNVHPGRYMAEGDALAELVSTSGPLIRFSVSVGELDQLTEGASVRFTAGDVEGEARVRAVSPVVRQETRQVDVEAAIEGDSALPSGAFVKVHVPIGRQKDYLAVPVTAVRNINGETLVFRVVEKDGETVAEARPVKLGAYVGDLRLVESGLAPDDRVVSIGAFKLSDGAKVFVSSAPQPQAKLHPTPSKS